MNYIVSTTDVMFDSLENLYNAPVKAVGYKRKVAAFTLFLIVSSMNEEAYGAEWNTHQGSQQTTGFVESLKREVPCVQLSGVELKLNNTTYKLFARDVSTVWQRQESLNILRESFFANFDEGQTDIDRFSSLFKNLANELSKLKIKYAFIDVSRNKGMIDFNLNLDEDIFLSVAKELNETTGNVMFTIARNHKTIAIDEMPIRELVKKVNAVISQLKSVSR